MSGELDLSTFARLTGFGRWLVLATESSGLCSKPHVKRGCRCVIATSKRRSETSVRLRMLALSDFSPHCGDSVLNRITRMMCKKLFFHYLSWSAPQVGPVVAKM